jgi:hypothetical protein
MKLYTEQEIKRGLDNPVSFDMTTDEFINSLTPTHVPSETEKNQSYEDGFNTGFKHALTTIKNEINQTELNYQDNEQ